MQIGGDLESLQGALSEPGEVKDKVIGAGKCSALVKVLPGNAELYVSHDTWDDYQGMLRMYKLYDLKFSTSANGTGALQFLSVHCLKFARVCVCVCVCVRVCVSLSRCAGAQGELLLLSRSPTEWRRLLPTQLQTCEPYAEHSL